MFRVLILQPLSYAYNYMLRFNVRNRLKLWNYKPKPHQLMTTHSCGQSNFQVVLKHPATLLSVLAFFQSSPNTGTIKDEIDIDTLIYEADDLFSQNKFADIIELLQNLKESENVEILWRLSRALYNLSKAKNCTNSKALVDEAYTISKRAVQLDDKHYATHKWYSILLDAYAGSQGIKARINELMNVKKHMMRAIELNPSDATTLYMLGSWCFGIAEMPWYQRQLVAAIFATPPTSSFEEALVYFKKAEEVSPLFYSLNLLMLGKTYMKLKNFQKAHHYLKLASTYQARTDEDLQANQEATDLLSHIPL